MPSASVRLVRSPIRSGRPSDRGVEALVHAVVQRIDVVGDRFLLEHILHFFQLLQGSVAARSSVRAEVLLGVDKAPTRRSATCSRRLRATAPDGRREPTTLRGRSLDCRTSRSTASYAGPMRSDRQPHRVCSRRTKRNLLDPVDRLSAPATRSPRTPWPPRRSRDGTGCGSPLWSLNPFGQCITMPLRVPPKSAAICFVQVNGASVATAQADEKCGNEFGPPQSSALASMLSVVSASKIPFKWISSL